MRLRTHILLGRKLHDLLDGSIPHKRAFVIGNVLPDILINLRMVSHNNPMSKEYITKELEVIKSHKKNSVLNSIRLGIVNHFLSDACCVPHTEEFFGGFFKHYKHEIKLNRLAKEFFLNESGVIIRTEDIYQELNNALLSGYKTLKSTLDVDDERAPSIAD